MSAAYQAPALFLTALCHAIVVYHMSEHKYPRRTFMVYSGIYMLIFISMGVFGYAEGGGKALFAYVAGVGCLFLYSCVVSCDYFSKKSFLFITYFCLFSVLDNMLKLMVNLFLPQVSVLAGYYVAVVLRTVVLLLVLIPYKKYGVAVFRSLTYSGKRWWNLALIALLFYVLQVAVSVLNVRNTVSNVYLFLVFAAISFAMCVVYSVVFSNISYMKKDAEAALVRQNAEYLSSRLSVLQAAEEANRRLRHDMRHHLETIVEYAKAADTSAILAYAGEYRTEISEAAVKQYSLNRTVNSILSSYADKAGVEGIAFSIQCNVPKKLGMREIDIIAILGNLLENALHGCQDSGKENPSMEIHIRLQKGKLIIVCSNSCSQNLELSGNLPVGKSIGISSILSVCQKYDGNLDYRIENEVCSVRAVLNL